MKTKAAIKPVKSRSLEVQTANKGYIFILPFIIGLVLFFVPMLGMSFYYIFNQIKMGAGGATFQFVGLQNLKDALFKDVYFLDLLVKTIGSMLLEIPMIIFYSLFIATLINGKLRGKGVFRMIMMIPVILATGLIEQADSAGYVMSMYMDPSQNTLDVGGTLAQTSGIFSKETFSALALDFGINTDIVDTITGFVSNIYSIITHSGVQLIIFLAGLQAISAEVYEAAYVEGATSWERFWKITIPMVSPMIIVNIVYTIIDTFTRESNQVMAHINRLTFMYGDDMGLPTAMSWIYFLVIAVILAIVFAVFARMNRNAGGLTERRRT